MQVYRNNHLHIFPKKLATKQKHLDQLSQVHEMCTLLAKPDFPCKIFSFMCYLKKSGGKSSTFTTLIRAAKADSSMRASCAVIILLLNAAAINSALFLPSIFPLCFAITILFSSDSAAITCIITASNFAPGLLSFGV